MSQFGTADKDPGTFNSSVLCYEDSGIHTIDVILCTFASIALLIATFEGFFVASLSFFVASFSASA